MWQPLSQWLKKAWRPVGDCPWLSLVPQVPFSALTRLVEAIGQWKEHPSCSSSYLQGFLFGWSDPAWSSCSKEGWMNKKLTMRHLTIILLYLHFLSLLSFWYCWVQTLMLYLHTNYEKLLVSLSEEKHEFHLALSPEISLLRDFVAPILL